MAYTAYLIKREEVRDLPANVRRIPEKKAERAHFEALQETASSWTPATAFDEL